MAIFIYLNKFWLKPIDYFSFINGLKPVPIDKIALLRQAQHKLASLLAMTLLVP